MYIKLRVSTGRKAREIKNNDDKDKRLTKKSRVLRARKRNISKENHFVL